MTRKSIIKAQNCDVYRGQKLVLRELNLEINSGERLAILGPNGSGKTTLLKLLSRELYPRVSDTSFIELFGSREVNLWHLRKRIGYVSHESQVAHRTLANGRHVILSAFVGSIGIHPHHQFSDEQHKRVERILDELNIQELADRPFLQLSNGQQRRLLLARARVHEPEMIILDEPTNGLDVGASFAVIDDMRRLANSGVGLILITHHLQEIIPEIDRVILMRDGRIVADAEKGVVLTEENLSKAYGTSITLSHEGGYYHWRPSENPP